MIELDLRKIAEDLDIAIENFTEVLYILNASEGDAISEEVREQLEIRSKECTDLESLKNESDLRIIERSIHYYSRQQAIDKINAVLEELNEARGLINV